MKNICYLDVIIGLFLLDILLEVIFDKMYNQIPEYVRKYETAFLLSSYSKDGKLTAFFAIDMSAQKFSTYLI